MDSSDDEVFCGPVSEMECHLRERLMSLCFKKTESFDFSFSLNEVSTCDSSICNESNSNPSKTDGNLNETTSWDTHDQLKHQLGIGTEELEEIAKVEPVTEPNSDLKDEQVSAQATEKSSGYSSISHIAGSDDELKSSTFVPGFSRSTDVSSSPLLFARLSHEDHLKSTKDAETIRCSLYCQETYEDLNLVTMPVGADITISTDRTGVPVTNFEPKMECVNSHDGTRLFELLEEAVELKIPPMYSPQTAINAFEGYNLSQEDEKDVSPSQCLAETSGYETERIDKIISNTNRLNQNDTSLQMPNDNLVPNEPVVVRKLEPELSSCIPSYSPKMAILANRCEQEKLISSSSACYNDVNEDFWNRNIGIFDNKSENLSDIQEDEEYTSIITVHASDQTALEKYSNEESSCSEDDVSIRISDTRQKENIKCEEMNQNYSLANTMRIPEITEHHQHLLRQLWFSTYSSSPESSHDSPLVNSLNLEVKCMDVLTETTTSKNSLNALDLSVSEQLAPAFHSMDTICQPKLEPLEEHAETCTNNNSDQQIPSTFRARKTPLKVISHKVGIVNIAKCTADEKPSIKRQPFFKPLYTPRLNKFSGNRANAENAVECVSKKQYLPQGSNRKVNLPKDRFFNSPCVLKKRDVTSPVARYINEEPVRPLVKIVRSKDVKALPAKSQNSSRPCVSTPSFSRQRLPEANYKLQQNTVSHMSSTESQAQVQPRSRLFPSPYTPQLTRHKRCNTGHAKEGSKPLTMEVSDLHGFSADDINKSTTEVIFSHRTKTLFN